MDKKKLAGYALMGLSSALLIGCQQNAGKPSQQKSNNGKSKSEQSALVGNGKNGSQPAKMTPQEQSFYNKLSAQGKKDFEAMSSADRQKAMKEANNCASKNSCKGLGGCSTSEHSCMGQNDCKGKGGCSKTPDESVSLMKKVSTGGSNGSSRY
ncbi:MAG: hypothetical protein AB7F31_02675 [Parachlamydiales bacterium]